MDKRKSFLVGAQILSLILLGAGSILITGCTSIHTAARRGDVRQVKRQLAWGVNPNTRTLWYLDTPLHKAAAYGRVEIVKLLIENGADVNLGNEGSGLPLHYAAGHGHTEVVKILLDHGSDVSEKGTGCGTPLQWAARNGQIKAAKLILAYGADINQQGTDERTALMDAARRGDADMVKLLLSRGADVNARAAYGHTALHSAAQRNNVEAARILLEHGADPALEGGRKTALYYAVLNENIDMIKLLLSKGAPVDATADGVPMALYTAAHGGNVEIARILLEHGADPALDYNGWTALNQAVSHEHIEMVKLLLANGAPVDVRAPTALYVASRKGNVEIGRMLLEHGSDPTITYNGRSVPEEFLRLIRESASDAKTKER